MASHATLLAPSHEEPWGLVIHEAAAMGMSVICSAACGAADAFVREGENALLLRRVTPDAIAQALLALHRKSSSELAAMSAASSRLAAMHTPRDWAQRVVEFVPIAGMSA